jgi:tetratricopeptide (TPR) repeat protein
VTGRYPEALQAYQQSRQIVERLASDHPAITEFEQRKAGIYAQIAEVLLATGQVVQAKELLQQAQEILERIIAADPAQWRARQWCAGVYVQSGFAELGLKHFEEAMAFGRRAQAIFEEQLQEDPDQLENLRDLGQCLQLTAEVHEASGQRIEALRSYQRAINLLEKTPEDSLRHNKPMLHILIMCYTELGNCQCAAGERAGAEHTYRQVLEIRQRYFRGDNTYATLRRFYPAWIALGQLQIDSGKPDEGRRTLQQLRELVQKLPPQDGREKWLADLEKQESEARSRKSQGNERRD